MKPWLTWALLALFSWGLWAVFSKLLGAALNAEQCQALSTVGLLPVLAVLVFSPRATMRGVSRRGLLLALAGGVTSCLGNIPYYAAVARGEKFASVVSLAALAPVVTVLLALLLLRERLNRVQCAGLGLALAAIWLFNVSTGTDLLSPAVAVALPPIALWGLSAFLMKVSTNRVTAEASGLVYLGAFVPMGAYYALSQPWPADLTARSWLLVIALGFFLAFGNLALLASFAHGGKAAVITPLTNLFPVVTIAIALLLLGESVSARELAGIACALASVAALTLESPAPSKPHEPDH